MKATTHPRNRYQGHYNIKGLLETFPELGKFAKKNVAGEPSIDFANPAAVKSLNRALLNQYYGIVEWDIPDQYLCPPIPGRADYIHHLADLLAVNERANGRATRDEGGDLARGAAVRVLDVGVGANCIYPILGHCEYGWSYVGSDIDPVALANAQKIIDANSKLASTIELRRQTPPDILKGIIKSSERFDLTMCNPPFHASAFEAAEVNRKKWRNLGKAPVTNFGGQNNELWVEGGEIAFIRRMIEESATMRTQVLWFTSFVSKEASLKPLYGELAKNEVLEYRVMDMEQGQKRSRLLAWTFLGGKAEWNRTT
ncbi:MAG: 23S rRNA (adenine(1618)-N(6))-methyltransferase RlmF [Bdellovibrionales bacterium]|nr:23S rRNA (adenine(1618)-N(6))-methyltransferase RlmF [Bdellovibrionales bacterium]